MLGKHFTISWKWSEVFFLNRKPTQCISFSLFFERETDKVICFIDKCVNHALNLSNVAWLWYERASSTNVSHNQEFPLNISNTHADHYTRNDKFRQTVIVNKVLPSCRLKSKFVRNSMRMNGYKASQTMLCAIRCVGAHVMYVCEMWCRNYLDSFVTLKCIQSHYRQ